MAYLLLLLCIHLTTSIIEAFIGFYNWRNDMFNPIYEKLNKGLNDLREIYYYNEQKINFSVVLAFTAVNIFTFSYLKRFARGKI